MNPSSPFQRPSEIVFRMPRSILAVFLHLCAAAFAAEPSAGGKGFNMDYGPLFSYTINCSNYTSNGVDNVALKGVAIRLEGGAAVCFDTELVRYAAAWTGGFLDLSNTHLTSYKGSREAFIAGDIHFRTRPVPGWTVTNEFRDPRSVPAGPLPRDWARWKGLYRHGSNVVLRYSVGNADVYEIPGCEVIEGTTVFTRTIELPQTAALMNVLICDAGDNARQIPSTNEHAIAVSGTNTIFAMCSAAPVGARLVLSNGQISLRLPPIKQPVAFTISTWSAPGHSSFDIRHSSLARPSSLCQGGPALWPDPIITKGRLGFGRGAYLVDTITIPEQNPWRSWMRLVAFDFFSDGRAAVSTWNGDVWLVSGIDETLQKIAWKRFAAGVHEPLGLKIVDDVVHVLGRDGITRLRDLNADGEADYYENLNNDVPISPSYHAFAMDLDTDRAGNFYHARCGQRIDPALALNGGMVRTSKDGSTSELIATGLRAANGLSVGPNDELVSSDNQGNWVPASRINLIKPGKFYGYVPHARLSAVPTDFEKPICWIPASIDNSGGGQAWITGERWGPLTGNLLHTSYGKSALFLLMTEQTNGQWQGGVFQFPLRFESGIMRARFNPRDGQFYVCGLKGWQTTGARDGAFHRVRYTGAPVRMPRELRVRPEGIEIGFTAPLERSSAEDTENWAVQQWNYRWTQAYGSDDYSVEDPQKKGRDSVEISGVELSSDARKAFLKISKLQPVMQMRIQFRLKAQDGEAMAGEIYNTINRIR
jgi:hypothetical protein